MSTSNDGPTARIIAIPIPPNGDPAARRLVRDHNAATEILTCNVRLEQAIRTGAIHTAALATDTLHTGDDATEAAKDHGLPQRLNLLLVPLPDGPLTEHLGQLIPQAEWSPDFDVFPVAWRMLGTPMVLGTPSAVPNTLPWAEVSEPWRDGDDHRVHIYAGNPHTLVLPRFGHDDRTWADLILSALQGDADPLRDAIAAEALVHQRVPGRVPGPKMVNHPAMDDPVLHQWAQDSAEAAAAWQDAYEMMVTDGTSALGADHQQVRAYVASHPDRQDDGWTTEPTEMSRNGGVLRTNWKKLLDAEWAVTNGPERLARAVRHGLLDGVQTEIDAARLRTAPGWVLQRDIDLLVGKGRVVYRDLLHPDDATLDLLDVAARTAGNSVRKVQGRFVTSTEQDDNLAGVASVGETGIDDRGRAVVFSPDLIVWAASNPRMGDPKAEATARRALTSFEQDMQERRERLNVVRRRLSDAKQRLGRRPNDPDTRNQIDELTAEAEALEHFVGDRDHTTRQQIEYIVREHVGDGALSRAQQDAAHRIATSMEMLADWADTFDHPKANEWQELALLLSAYIDSDE